MSAGFDPEDDFAQIADGLRAVRFLRPGTSLAAEVAHALPRPRQLVNSERSDGQYTIHDRIWHLPAAELPAAPQPGDVVADDVRWTVLTAQATLLGRHWRCVCRNLAAFWGLDQYVDLQEAVFALGEQGDERPSWRTCRTGIAARIEPLTAEVTSNHARTATVTRYRISCAEPLELTHRHRLRGPDGTIYQIVHVEKAAQVDALLKIETERWQ